MLLQDSRLDVNACDKVWFVIVAGAFNTVGVVNTM